MRGKPLILELESGLPQPDEYLREVALNGVGQHEAVVERGAPADQAAFIRRLPKHADQSADQQHLKKIHSYMRRHFERPQFEQAKLQPESRWRKELVYAELGAMRVPGDIGEQVTKQSIYNERRTIARGQMTKRNFELVQGVDARFVHARILARRTDIHPGERVRQRRMILPERHHAAQQIRSAQNGTVRDGCSTDHDVAASPGGNMAAVIREFFSRQPIVAGFLVEHRIDPLEL